MLNRGMINSYHNINHGKTYTNKKDTESPLKINNYKVSAFAHFFWWVHTHNAPTGPLRSNGCYFFSNYDKISMFYFIENVT